MEMLLMCHKQQTGTEGDGKDHSFPYRRPRRGVGLPGDIQESSVEKRK